MFYYLTCFFSSSFLFWFGQKLRTGQSEIFRWFIYGIALLIPAILAGVRDLEIGIDTLFYGYPIFVDAVTAPYIDGMSSRWDGWIEPGFLCLNFLVSRVTDDYNIFSFILSFITILFVFVSVYKWKDKIPIWLGMFVFYSFFFNESLNIMRQCLALAIVFCSAEHIFNKKFLRFAFWILLASLFHRSSFIFLLYYPLFWYSNKFTSGRSTLLISSFILLLIIFSNEIFIPLLYSLSDVIPFARQAVGYITLHESDRIPYKIFIYFCFLLALFFYKRKNIFLHFPNIGHFLKLIAISIVIAQLLPIVGGKYVYRFIFIAEWWLLILIPIIYYSYRKNIVTASVFVSYCLFFFYFTYILNDGGTANYSSSILNRVF